MLSLHAQKPPRRSPTTWRREAVTGPNLMPCWRIPYGSATTRSTNGAHKGSRCAPMASAHPGLTALNEARPAPAHQTPVRSAGAGHD